MSYRAQSKTVPAALSADSIGRRRADLGLAAVFLAVVAAAALVGIQLNNSPVHIFADAPPLFGMWLPHIGPGTPAAIVLAIAVVACGRELAHRMAWRSTLTLSYVFAVAWTFSLAMIDGWDRGIASRLTTNDEYLHDVPKVDDIGAMLRTFSSRILDFQPDSWTTHVSGHPPGAFLVFVWLQRIGLGGGGNAGVACVLVGAVAAIAVPVTIKALGSERLARNLVPFAVLFPGAVWFGVSADGLFAGVTSVGIALIAVGAARLHQPKHTVVLAGLAAVAGGILVGFGIFLSYGLALLGLVVLVVLLINRSFYAFLLTAIGVIAVFAAFTVAGFWWFDGYRLVVERYYQGIGAIRPYYYWVWADFAALFIAIGPAAVAAVHRVFPGIFRLDKKILPVASVACATLIVILAADLSGLSKAEVERIWLPFAVWLTTTTALLPARTSRWWLAAQAVTALLVNHLLLTNW